MRACEDVKLNGVEGTFTIQQLPAERSYYLLLDIAAVVTPSAAKSLKESPTLDFGKLDVGTLAEAFEGLFRKANREEVKRITAELFSGVEWNDGKQKVGLTAKGAYEIAFGGNVLGIFLLQKEALRVNYAPFFKGLAEAIREAVSQLKGKRYAVSSTSGGPSGDSSQSA